MSKPKHELPTIYSVNVSQIALRAEITYIFSCYVRHNVNSKVSLVRMPSGTD